MEASFSKDQQQQQQQGKQFRGMKSLPMQNQTPVMEKPTIKTGRKKKPSLNAGELATKKSPRTCDMSLLNFRFPERQEYHSHRHSSRYRGDQPTFNKERFVNANFRFVVDPQAEISLVDPDLILKWENVDQMIIPTSSPSCPICLSVPVAPRASKCGHLFCMPCILHYISLSDHTWRKCPICFESIYPSALKPVVFLTRSEMNTPTLTSPTSLDFTLVRRDVGSTIALPIISFRKWKTKIPSVDVISAIEFAKFITSTPEYLQIAYEKDLESLNLSLNEADSGSYEPTFIQTSIDSIKISQSAINQTPVSQDRILPKEDSLFFYQSSDGQHTYLHPLDIKILKHEFKSYERFPAHLSLNIINAKETSITNDVRKRFKYLSHLPLTCKVMICETNLDNIVSEATLATFAKELAERDKRIKKEMTKLKVAEKAVAPEERYIYDGYVPEESFVYQQEDFVPLTSSLSSSPVEGITIPARSFATAASSNTPPPSSPGWQIDLSDEIIKVKLGGEKKKKKGVLLFGNSGSRARQ